MGTFIGLIKKIAHVIVWPIIIGVLVFAIISPILIDKAVIHNPAVSVTIKDWIGFWGNYIGALIGALTTLFAFYFTFTQNKKQNAITQNQINEQMRLHVLPIIETEQGNSNTPEKDIIRLSSEGIIVEESYKAYVHKLLGCKNIGAGTAFDVTISAGHEVHLGHFSVDRQKTYLLLLPEEGSKDFTLSLKIGFHDIENRKYEQTFEVEKNASDYWILPATPPKLLSSNKSL